MNIKHVYTEPRLSPFSARCRLKPNASDTPFAHGTGVVVPTSKTQAGILPWDDLMHFAQELISHDPRAREHMVAFLAGLPAAAKVD